MPLVAEFDINCEHLPFVPVARTLPDATLVLTLQSNHDELPVFILSVSDGNRTTIEETFDDPSVVGKSIVLGEAVETCRYQVLPGRPLEEHLGPHIDNLSGIEALATTDGIIERIEVLSTGWRQSGWFAHREAFDKFREFCQRNGGFHLHRLTQEGETEPPGDGLTDRQREALRTAYGLGYFDISPTNSVTGSACSKTVRLSQREHPTR